MCIICNLDVATEKFPDRSHNVDRADEFLGAFQRAHLAMKEATDALHKCAEIVPRYDRTHKQMVRMCREWNALEQAREAEAPVGQKH